MPRTGYLQILPKLGGESVFFNNQTSRATVTIGKLRSESCGPTMEAAGNLQSLKYRCLVFDRKPWQTPGLVPISHKLEIMKSV